MSQESSPSLALLLKEASIQVAFEASDMEDAIGQLATQLFEAHAPSSSAADFLRSAIKRERLFPTCLGEGIATPHGELEGGGRPVAALGVQGRGLPILGPDGKPVELVVLLGVPSDQREFHVRVLAAIAGGLGQDASLRAELGRCADAAAVLRTLAG